MLFPKEIDQDKIQDEGNNDRNNNRPVIDTIASSYKELVNKIINNHYNYNSNDPFSFLHNDNGF